LLLNDQADTPIPIAATSRGWTSSSIERLLKTTLNLSGRIIDGYGEVSEIVLAFYNHEVDGALISVTVTNVGCTAKPMSLTAAGLPHKERARAHGTASRTVSYSRIGSG
jgi:hypothetical protein